MRTVFYLSNEEHREIKTKGLNLQVSGETFTLMVERPHKIHVEPEGSQNGGAPQRGAKPGTPFPKPYPKRFRAKVLKLAAKTSAAEAAKKFHITPGTVRTWQQQEAK